MSKVFYFGCIEGTGHYLWAASGARLHHESHPDFPADFPVQIHALDGGLMPPKQPPPQERAFLAHINGWTIISFTDCSVDKRPGSHSAFIVRGIMNLTPVLDIARQAFPRIFARFSFEIKE